jgi:AraC-like DNA-binding protein
MLGAAMTKNKESLDESPRTSLFERIRVFIEKRLDDTDLSPSTIARAHSISLRYLHLLFSERGVTVGGWVRSRRLARCRVALADVRKDRTITEIALKWGFSDAAHFSRSFKAAFGISPNAFRRAKPMRARVGDCRCMLRRGDRGLLEIGVQARVPVSRVVAHRGGDNSRVDRARLVETQTSWPRRHRLVAIAAECRLRCSGHVWAVQITTQAKRQAAPAHGHQLRLASAASACGVTIPPATQAVALLPSLSLASNRSTPRPLSAARQAQQPA